MPKPVGRTPPVPDDGSSFDSVVAKTSRSVTTKGLRAFLNRGWRTRPEEARGSHSIPPCHDVGFAVNQLQVRSVPTHPQLSASGRQGGFRGLCEAEANRRCEGGGKCRRTQGISAAGLSGPYTSASIIGLENCLPDRPALRGDPSREHSDRRKYGCRKPERRRARDRRVAARQALTPRC